MNNPLKFLGEPFLLDEESSDDVVISFIADEFPASPYYQKSVISIDDIADEIGLKHEIILISPPIAGGKFSVAGELGSKIETLTVLYSGGNNRGRAIKRAIEHSSGKFIVFFSPDKVYSASSSDVLVEFIRHRDKKLLLSCFSAFPRSLMDIVGSSADLKEGALPNLYARMAHFFGVIVCQPKGMNSITLSSEFTINRASFLSSSLQVFRYVDSLAANGFKIMETMASLRSGGISGGRVMRGFFIMFCAVMASFRRLVLKDNQRGRFITLVESAMESIILGEFKRFNPDWKPRIELSNWDYSMVKLNSKLWERTGDSVRNIVQLTNREA